MYVHYFIIRCGTDYIWMTGDGGAEWFGEWYDEGGTKYNTRR